MSKILYLSDFSLSGSGEPRSGYSGIGMALCDKLQRMGHDVKALGLGYTGVEHAGSFSLIPCNTPQDAAGLMKNLRVLWQPNVAVVALDIHYFQETFFPIARKLGMRYICITPLESEPLCPSWANLLSQMDKVFFISKFGTDEAQKVGVNAEHLKVGIDCSLWRERTREEYDTVRKTLGLENNFVVLTVADNQERKNLSRGFEIVAELKKHGVKVKHVLVTRENSMVGWKLYDLAMRFGISSDLHVFQSGLPFRDLYALYAGADAFLLCSKGEGLGLPIMEAMSVGVPVVASAVGAIPELLADERGWPIEPEYMMIDPFGNQNRYFMSISRAVEALLSIHRGEEKERTAKARKFIQEFSWDTAAGQVDKAVSELARNGQNNPVW